MRRINNSFTFARMYRSAFFYPCLLVLLWVLMICIVNPIGNFPLNDDWQYARPVWFLINKGYYFSPDKYSPIIAAQVLWGTLFCLPGGFSFTALRVSVLVLGLIGVFVFYFLINRISHNKKIAFLGALLLLINPLYFSLSNTFMTDVPFLVFALISISLFFRALDNHHKGYLVFAVIFSIIATLIRQFGVVIPIAYSIAVIVKNKPNIKQAAFYFLPPLITIVALELTLLWLKHIGSELHPYDGKSMVEFLSKPADIARYIFNRSGFLLFYTGFFLLPYTLFSGNIFLQNRSRKKKMTVLSLIIIFLPSLIHACINVPVGNILGDGSIGPTTFRFENFWSDPGVIDIPYFGPLFTILSFAGAILLLIKIGTIIVEPKSPEKSYSTQQVFIVVCIFGYAFLMFIPDFFFDRYLLIFFPLFFLLSCRANHEVGKIRVPAFIISSILISLTAVFSTSGTHDYLAWNRARWSAWNYATTTMHIAPSAVDGGYECNGWSVGQFIYDPKVNTPPDLEYVLSFGERREYFNLKQFPYQNYLPYQMRNICILRRKKISGFYFY